MSRVAPAKEAFFQKINFRSLETRAPEYQELHNFWSGGNNTQGQGFWNSRDSIVWHREEKKQPKKSEASDEKMETPGAGDDGHREKQAMARFLLPS